MLQRFRKSFGILKFFIFWFGHVAVILAYLLFYRPLAWIAGIKWRISRFTARHAIRWGRTPGFAVIAIMIAAFATLYLNFEVASAGISSEDALTRSLAMSDDDQGNSSSSFGEKAS